MDQELMGYSRDTWGTILQASRRDYFVLSLFYLGQAVHHKHGDVDPVSSSQLVPAPQKLSQTSFKEISTLLARVCVHQQAHTLFCLCRWAFSATGGVWMWPSPVQSEAWLCLATQARWSEVIRTGRHSCSTSGAAVA